ncbi:MAG: tRNA (N6-threonylcarbamoyladenosine(37)-N6)-methyltransferase TrmO [Bacteroidales bacterium]|nr:tRNA (N6-threonylcarbamoyladenosine(37)-N6)-methyltransferase TrmO [Bacteroidales bacterium]
MNPIAHIESGFKEKFGVPRQSNLAGSSLSRIVFEKEYRNPEALRGLDGFDYIWIIWEFSENGPRWQPTVRPPRLGGNRRMGVFATRSTFRPNALGLSSVRLERIYTDPVLGPVVEVSGADLVDGTPIFDIKPYITYADSHPDAASGWVDEVAERRLDVVWAAEARGLLPDALAAEIGEILSLDPRPSYIEDPERVYGFSYRGHNIKFRVSEGTLTIVSIGID